MQPSEESEGGHEVDVLVFADSQRLGAVNGCRAGWEAARQQQVRGWDREEGGEEGGEGREAMRAAR
jgi:hypothetical protein